MGAQLSLTDRLLILYKEYCCGAFEDMLTIHCRKSTGVNNKMNDG